MISWIYDALENSERVIIIKKFIKITFVCLLIMFVVMSISIVSPIIQRSKIADRYKETYNIDFETPKTLEQIFIEGLRDVTYLNKLTYDEETYKKMLECDYVIKINKELMAVYSSIRKMVFMIKKIMLIAAHLKKASVL